MPVTRLAASYKKKAAKWHAYQNTATDGADEDQFMKWKKKNNDWLKPGGDEKGRKTGIVYVVRPKPGQEKFIKVGSTNEIWDRFKNRYREYLPAGFEMYAVAQYAGMTVKEEGQLKKKYGKELARGGASATEIADKIDEQATSAAKSKALLAEKAIHKKLRDTIGDGAYYDKNKRDKEGNKAPAWQPVRYTNNGEWFDVKATNKPKEMYKDPSYYGYKDKTFDNPNKNNMNRAPAKITAKKDNYIPFVLDMVKQQGRFDNMKDAMSGGQMRYFNGYDIKEGNTLAQSYQSKKNMYKKREAWEAFNKEDFDRATDWAKRLRPYKRS